MLVGGVCEEREVDPLLNNPLESFEDGTKSTNVVDFQKIRKFEWNTRGSEDPKEYTLRD